ncbi:3-oxoacyl-ACP reductase [Streptomyces sp. PRh5]|uniref:3-oxoacyl-ACP reductase FabG n=1 Tax=Streptomyces sp. PRh5 TaxID=1158056 RepID=UPI0004479A03|nr:3-oxoacyl-ACP reductase FabG [Streptomyces sp. PRh5]EXU61878.1 3-oxoacyl-ACP reductase [Streptomyces sp. PRh5]
MNRAVLVTGGNRGIGFAIASLFHDRGDRVAVTYRSSPPSGDFPGIRCDVTDEVQVDRTLAEFEELYGPVEILVANAGVTHDKLILRMTDEEFESVLATNLTGVFRLARAVSGKMARSRWGRMVFISSVVGTFGAPGQSNYAASKAGLTGLARSLAWELGPRGITVNVVAPGLIDTDMTAGISDERRDLLVGITPLGRMGTPQDVAHAVAFLASEEARFVTGAILPVSGGLAMGH